MKDNFDFYKASKIDVVIVVLVLFFSAVGLFNFIFSRIQNSAQPRTVLIYQKDNLLKEINLGNSGVIAILDNHMQLEVKEGKIRVKATDCPRHICMNMGWIKYSGQTIVCVPNQIIIEIKSSRHPSVLDVVAY